MLQQFMLVSVLLTSIINVIPTVSGNTVQDFCSGAYTAYDWVNDLIEGNNVLTVSNVVYKGACTALGKVTYVDGINYIGYTSGIGTTALVLTSGAVSTAAESANTRGSATTMHGTAGDSDLSSLNGGAVTVDAAVIEFDIVSSVNVGGSFSYVFASEEYPEYVGSPSNVWNDVFAFWVNGVNIALIGTTVVSINNVNHLTLSEYFVDNSAASREKYYTEYAGLTTLLETKTFQVTANQVVHVKLAIADVGDYEFDSVVFIQPKSFQVKECDGTGIGDECDIDGDCFQPCQRCCIQNKICEWRPQYNPAAHAQEVGGMIDKNVINDKDTHYNYYGYIILVGVIAFILVNNVIIGCWCLRKGGEEYKKVDMIANEN